MDKKPLPIGVENFEKLITRGYYYETQGVQAPFLGAVVPQWNSISLSAFCEEMSPDRKHAKFHLWWCIRMHACFIGNFVR